MTNLAKDEIIKRLQQAGIKPTTQRVMILDYLLRNLDHPSSEKIFQDLQSQDSVLSKATVYNTVNILLDKGLVAVLETGDEVAHYDVELHEHAHFQCHSCRKIWNVALPDMEVNNPSLPEGFISTGVQVLVKGYCVDCANSLQV